LDPRGTDVSGIAAGHAGGRPLVVEDRPRAWPAVDRTEQDVALVQRFLDQIRLLLIGEPQLAPEPPPDVPQAIELLSHAMEPRQRKRDRMGLAKTRCHTRDVLVRRRAVERVYPRPLRVQLRELSHVRLDQPLLAPLVVV